MKIKNTQSIICLIMLFLFANQAWAGNLYVCIDKDGKEILSSTTKKGMKCDLKESFKDLTTEEKANIERKKAIANQKRENADIRMPDALCKRECEMGRSSCESDCSRRLTRDYNRGACITNCLNYQNSCINRCYY